MTCTVILMTFKTISSVTYVVTDCKNNRFNFKRNRAEHRHMNIRPPPHHRFAGASAIYTTRFTIYDLYPCVYDRLNTCKNVRFKFRHLV